VLPSSPAATTLDLAVAAFGDLCVRGASGAAAGGLLRVVVLLRWGVGDAVGVCDACPALGEGPVSGAQPVVGPPGRQVAPPGGSLSTGEGASSAQAAAVVTAGRATRASPAASRPARTLAVTVRRGDRGRRGDLVLDTVALRFIDHISHTRPVGHLGHLGNFR
jgi:hypothetical protein